MARFDELFDTFLGKAKEMAGTASEKTADFVEIGKLRYRQNQVASEIEKKYAKLGAIVYEAEKNGERYDKLIHLAVNELTELNKKYDNLVEAITLVGKHTTIIKPKRPIKVPAIPYTETKLEDLDCPVCDDLNLEVLLFDEQQADSLENLQASVPEGLESIGDILKDIQEPLQEAKDIEVEPIAVELETFEGELETFEGELETFDGKLEALDDKMSVELLDEE